MRKRTEKLHKTVLFTVFSLMMIFTESIHAYVKNPSVLILNSYNQNFKWTDDIIHGVLNQIKKDFPDAEIFIEDMDLERINPGPEFSDDLRRFYRYKFSKIRFDLIICTDRGALEFASDGLFRGIPLVFCGVNDFNPDIISGSGIITGVAEVPDLAGTVKLALQVNSRLHKLIIVGDNTADTVQLVDELRNISENYRYTPEFDFTCTGPDVTMRKIMNHVAVASADSAVIFLGFNRDAYGTHYSYENWLPVICRVSTVPVYTHNDRYFGYGPLGGSINIGRVHGEEAGRIAVRVLKGKDAGTIPVETAGPVSSAFDIRQMRRHGIKAGMLPENSLVLFKDENIYEKYKTRIWMITSSAVILFLTTLFLIINISKRHFAEIALKQSEENLNITLNSIGDAVISTDVDGNILRMNYKAEELTGWTAGRAVGKHLKHIYRIKNRLTGKFIDDPVKAVLTSPETLDSKEPNILVRKNSAELLVSGTGAPILNSRNDFEGAVIVFRDITEKHHMDEHLRHSQKMEISGHLAGMMAGEFSEIIHGIIGACSLISSSPAADAALNEYTGIIMESAGKSTDLISKLLAFSRRGKTFSQRTDIHKMIDDALNRLQTDKTGRLEIRRNFHAANSFINADVKLMRDAFLHLGINALESMEHGGVLSFSTENVTLDGSFCSKTDCPVIPGEYIEIKIIDTGCGIGRENISRIFEPFFTTKNRGGANGLGLSAAYGTVREHRGMINVQSSPGSGTSISILLPVDYSKTPELQPETGTGIPPFPGNILLVDDEPYVLSLTSKSLSKMGYNVLTAENAFKAIDIFRKNKNTIPIVIMDMIMSDMNGTDAYEELRKISSDFKIIFSSGYNDGGNSAGAVISGCPAFIRKPYMISELHAMILQILNTEKK